MQGNVVLQKQELIICDNTASVQLPSFQYVLASNSLTEFYKLHTT